MHVQTYISSTRYEKSYQKTTSFIYLFISFGIRHISITSITRYVYMDGTWEFLHRNKYYIDKYIYRMYPIIT